MENNDKVTFTIRYHDSTITKHVASMLRLHDAKLIRYNTLLLDHVVQSSAYDSIEIVVFISDLRTQCKIIRSYNDETYTTYINLELYRIVIEREQKFTDYTTKYMIYCDNELPTIKKFAKLLDNSL